MKGAITHDSSLARIRSNLKTLDTRRKNEIEKASASTNPSLFDLLPGRDTADRLVRLYFSTFETTYRILHAPTFWKEYQSFWEDPQKGRLEFAAILLLTIASVHCISTKEPWTFLAENSPARESALLWIKVCEIWLQYQSEKHLVLASFQIRCLLLLAKQTNVLKTKRAWTSAGTLLRFAMSAGLHRDPSLLNGKISVFDQEMRRRLWASMVELELQASFDRGMPSLSTGLSCDCAPPLNINDEDIDESSKELPKPKPSQEYTASSYLQISQTSLSLRVSLNSLLNDSGSNIQYQDMLLYDEKILQCLEAIPCWPDREGLQSSALTRALLDIQLRQYLVLLHSPFARQAGSHSRYELSRMVCCNTSKIILDQHSNLTASGNFALCSLRIDVFRAILQICHNNFISTVIRSSFSFSPLLDTALAMLEEKIMRLGVGFQEYWFSSAAYSLVRSISSAGHSSSQELQAIDRFTRVYYRIIAFQENLSKASVLPSRDRKVCSLFQSPIRFRF